VSTDWKGNYIQRKNTYLKVGKIVFAVYVEHKCKYLKANYFVLVKQTIMSAFKIHLLYLILLLFYSTPQ